MIQFKKLLLVSITLLSGMMSSGGAYAQFSDYTFSADFGTSPTYSNWGTISGMALVGPGGSVSSLSNLTETYGGTTRAITAFTLETSYVRSLSDFSLDYSYTGGYWAGTAHVYLNTLGSTHVNQPSFPGGGGVSSSSVVSAGAPEIDGSLAPKVGFLLGCLFLMFGRKKQNAELMLTA